MGQFAVNDVAFWMVAAIDKYFRLLGFSARA